MSPKPPSKRPARPAQRRAGPGATPVHVPAEAISIWKEGDVTQFKIAEIVLDENRSNTKLEELARAKARPVEAQISYAYRLDARRSTAWWQEWAGYDLEADILRASVLARPAVAQRLKTFDPKDNEWGVDNRDDFADILIHAHHAEIDAEDVRKGFRHWLSILSPQARRLFASDVRKWLRP